MFTFNETFSQGTWERINSPVTENLSSVFFVDSLFGWAAGNSGTIIHTSNGGTDWIIQDSKTENNIKDIFFLNRNLGWAIFWEVSNFPFGSYILKTTDCGENWINSGIPVESCFGQSLFFQDSLAGWMGGKPYPIVRTIDGGISWTDAEIDSTNFSDLPVYDIQFYNSRFGYASGGVIDCCGIMWWTTNGGDYWSVIDTPFIALEPIYQLYISDSLNVLGVGGDFESTGYGVGMIRTSDGGAIWEFEYIGISGVAWDVDFRTSSDVWAPLGGEANLIYSSDSGMSWSIVPAPDSALIFKITFPDSLHGFGVGMNGAIIKYKPDSTTSILPADNTVSSAYSLEQNYPNPFNPKTVISYQLPVTGNVMLKVYDILGNEVATLVNRELAAGNYKINFDAGELSGGVYFYQLKTRDYISIKKMILLR